jgi:hypothetical protein
LAVGRRKGDRKSALSPDSGLFVGIAETCQQGIPFGILDFGLRKHWWWDSSALFGALAA